MNSDTTVKYIDTTPPSEKMLHIKKSVRNGEFMCTFSVSNVTLYINRPSALHDVSFAEYFRKYDVRKPKAPSGPKNGKLLGVDALGNKVYALPVDRVLRFTTYHPVHNSNNFFYQVLLLREPFHFDSYLHTADGSYYNECVRRGFISSFEDLECVVHKYCDYHMYQDFEYDRMQQALIGQLGFEHMHLDDLHDGDIVLLPLMQTKAALHAMQDVSAMRVGMLPDTDDCIRNDVIHASARVDIDMLGAEQLHAFHEITSMVRANVAAKDNTVAGEQPQVVGLSGGPGTGKSFLTEKIIQQLVSDGFKVLVTATTAVAALRYAHVGSMGVPQTVHRAAQIPRNGMPLMPMHTNLLSEGIDALSTARGAMNAAEVMVCDEMSMLTTIVLFIMLYRMRQGTLVGTARKLLLLVGDHAQLPPVCFHKLATKETVCSYCHIMFSTVWRQATKFSLKHVFRQAKDHEFMEFLNIIRHRKPTQEEIDRYLGMCFWFPSTDAELLEGFTLDTTILCTHRRDVLHMNKIFLEWSQSAAAHLDDPDFVPAQIYEVSMVHNVPVPKDGEKEAPEFEAWKNLQSWVENEKHHSLTHVCVGARLMVNENLDVGRGVANSAMAEAVDVRVGVDGEVQKVEAQLLSNECNHMFTRSKVHRKYHGRGFWKKMFPLTLAYALTAHKCQGATIHGPGIIHVRKAFAPGMLYVMLSRFTERKNIRIMTKLTPEHFDFIPLVE